MRPALGLVSLSIVAACAAEPSPVVDLGGGDSPRAWHVVFVGDGYAPDELARYRATVDGLVDALVHHDGGFVAMAPEAFRFHRVDAVGPGWELGTHLDASDSCGEPFIEADPDRALELARTAVAAPDVVVVIAHDLDGRANAHGDVHISDGDDWHVLEHELSHALFHLGDEYTEMAWCSANAPDDAELLATANVTAADDDAKWGGAVTGIAAGGDRWPCLHHPTTTCTMNDAETGAYCPVCAAAIRETIAARLCRDDGAAPRVALVDPPDSVGVGGSGAMIALEAAAYDEGTIVAYRLRVDGSVVGDGPLPWADVAADTLASGAHVIEVDAVDAAGHVGTSPAHTLTVTRAGSLAPSVALLVATADTDGWIRAIVDATPIGGTVAIAAGAEPPVVAPIRAGAFDVWIPAPTVGPTIVTAIARTAAGAPSAPVISTVDVAGPLAAPPRIESVTVAGIAVESLAAIGPVVDIDVVVASCAPLDRVDVVDSAGTAIATAPVEARHGCAQVVPVTLAAATGAVTVIARDRSGRTDARAIALPPLGDPAACGIAPALDDATLALAHPGELALVAPGITLVGSAITVDGLAAPAFALTRADGTRGLLLAATDVPGPPRDGVLADLRVTVAAACGAGPLAATSIVPAVVDAVPPSLRVHRYVRAGESPVIDAHDGSDLSIETTSEGNQLVVRAIDAAGNITQRAVTVVTFPNDRAGCP